MEIKCLRSISGLTVRDRIMNEESRSESYCSRESG